MVCIPCLIVPALLLFAQWVYNRFTFVKRLVHHFFPALAAKEAAEAEQARQSAQHQQDFWTSKPATSNSSSSPSPSTSPDDATSDSAQDLADTKADKSTTLADLDRSTSEGYGQRRPSKAVQKDIRKLVEQEEAEEHQKRAKSS